MDLNPNLCSGNGVWSRTSALWSRGARRHAGLLGTQPHACPHLSATPKQPGGSGASPARLPRWLGEEHLLLPSPSTHRGYQGNLFKKKDAREARSVTRTKQSAVFAGGLIINNKVSTALRSGTEGKALQGGDDALQRGREAWHGGAGVMPWEEAARDALQPTTPRSSIPNRCPGSAQLLLIPCRHQVS